MITGISKLEKDLRKPKMWFELLMPIAELIRPQPYPSCYQLGARYTSATKSFHPTGLQFIVRSTFERDLRKPKCGLPY